MADRTDLAAHVVACLERAEQHREHARTVEGWAGKYHAERIASDELERAAETLLVLCQRPTPAPSGELRARLSEILTMAEAADDLGVEHEDGPAGEALRAYRIACSLLSGVWCDLESDERPLSTVTALDDEDEAYFAARAWRRTPLVSCRPHLPPSAAEHAIDTTRRSTP